MNPIFEKATHHSRWRITRYADEAAFRKGKHYSISEFEGNCLLNEGITRLQNLLIGGGGTTFATANAYLGAGNGPTPTALTGTLTFTNASATVTGSGTAFNTELEAGDVIRLNADDKFVEVLSVQSATSLTLTAVYAYTGGAGAGAKVDKPVATETGLAGASKTYKGQEAGYPTITNQTTKWRSIFQSADGNHRWLEFTVANGTSDAGENLNRRLSEQGSKSAGQVWTLDLEVLWS